MTVEQIAPSVVAITALVTTFSKVAWDFVKERRTLKDSAGRLGVDDDVRRDEFVKTITEIFETRIEKLHEAMAELREENVRLREQRDQCDAEIRMLKRRCVGLEVMLAAAGLPFPDEGAA